MKHFFTLKFAVLLALCAGALGCARAAHDTSGYAIQNDATVNAPFEETWQAVKGVLREQGYDIYTRDKRGIFVAYSPETRRTLKIVPHRVKYTIELAQLSSDETKVYIETVNQVYGTTLKTYPDWHDRPAQDNAAALEILAGLQAKLSGGEIAPATLSPAEEGGPETEDAEEAGADDAPAEPEEVEAAPTTI